MKKYVFISVLALTLVSCSDFIDHKEKGKTYVLDFYSGGKLINSYKSDNYFSFKNGVSIEYKDSTIIWGGEYKIKTINK